MEYVKEINIIEAVIHILDSNADEPVLNKFPLELNDEIYAFLLRHISKALGSENLRYAIFNEDRNIIKEVSKIYLNGESKLGETSEEIARQMFSLIKANGNIPSCDLIVISFSTEFGVMIGILKMDYVKNYTHRIGFIENEIGINIIPQFTGLPGSGQKIQKCAFIKPQRGESEFDLMVIDERSTKDNNEYAIGWFLNKFLDCSVINNERDMTKGFLDAAEKWARMNYRHDADQAEKLRSLVKENLKKEDQINLNEFSKEIFNGQEEAQKNFIEYVSAQGIEGNIEVDKEWVDKKLKKIRLKIDKDIEICIDEETYKNVSKFEISRNGDGTINMTIKHVASYIEK